MHRSPFFAFCFQFVTIWRLILTFVHEMIGQYRRKALCAVSPSVRDGFFPPESSTERNIPLMRTWTLLICLLLALYGTAVAVALGVQDLNTIETEPPVPTQEIPPVVQEEIPPAPDPVEGADDDTDEPAPYDFAQPVPEGETVALDYFDNAAFIGDSRTDGFLLYSGIGRGANLTHNGLTIFSLESSRSIRRGSEKYTVFELLEQEEYDKIYISLGINELGYYNDEGYYKSYLAAIETIRTLQPDATIYLQGLIPLNEQKIKDTGGKDYLTNEHLLIYNELIRQVAEESQTYFLDLYSHFADEDGILPYDASRDGVHLSKEYCQLWLDYLTTHAVGGPVA